MAASERSRTKTRGKNLTAKQQSSTKLAPKRLADLLDFNRGILHRDEEEIAEEADNLDDTDRNIRRLLASARQYTGDVSAAFEAEGRDGGGGLVPDRVEAFAQEILPIVVLLAHGGELPATVVARGRELFERDAAALERRLLPWQAGLLKALTLNDLISDANKGFPVGKGATLQSLDIIFDDAGSEAGFDGFPPIMQYFAPGGMNPRLEPKLRAAVQELKTIRIAHFGKRPGGRGKILSPFAAAAKLARALGLSFPEREFDLRRPARTRRR